jgi:hypothetical protein
MRTWAALALCVCGAVVLGGGSAVAGGAQPANGHYVGGGDSNFVWFDVSGGKVQSAQAQIRFGTSPCDYGTSVNGPVKPDADGRFKLTGSFAGDTTTLKGRFLTPRKVRGKLVYTTIDNCPADTYKFPYTATKLKPPG